MKHLALLARLDEALAGCDGEVELSAWQGRCGTTRFAGSQVNQSGEVATTIVQARVAEGGRLGAARIGDPGRAAIHEAVARARAIARAVPADPDAAGFDDGRAAAATTEAWDAATAASGAGDRAALVGRAFAGLDEAGLEGAGIAMAIDAATAVATTARARRAHRYTTFKLDLIASAGDASGSAVAYGRRIEDLDLAPLVAEASGQALAMRDPRSLPPADYDVVLAPRAVAELIEWLAMGSFGARALRDGSSCLAGRRGQPITSPQVTIYDDGSDPDPLALGCPFDAEGTPKRRVTFIDRGRAGEAANDRAGARGLGDAPTGHAAPLCEEMGWDSVQPLNLHLAAGTESADDLVRRVERGLLVTRLHYVNGYLDTRRATMTGLTRDGLRWIEDGRVAHGVAHLRFTDSLLAAFERLGGVSRERRLIPPAWWARAGGGLVVPTLLVRQLRFTGRGR